MRKIFFFTVMAVVVQGYSQTKGTIEMGVNIGYNMSSVSSAHESSDSGGGLNVGTSMEYYFSDRWGIKTKLIYDQKGWNNGVYIDGGFDPVVDGYITDYNLNYLTVPVLANWHFGRKRNWYLHFGPYVGFLMSATETEGGNDVKEAFNTTDFGLALGIGVKVPINDKMRIFFEYDGQGGFAELFKESSEAITNSRGSFNVGLNFILK